MKYYAVLFNVIIYIIIFGYNHGYVRTERALHCSLLNTTIGSITVYENIQLYHSIEFYAPTKSQRSFACFSTNRRVADILNITNMAITKSGIEIENVSLGIVIKRLGGANIMCSCNDNIQNYTTEVLTVVVERRITIQEIIFRVVILIFVIVITFVMGCSIEMKIVWNYLKKPIAPVIGLLSQYLIMPLLAFSISKLFNLNNDFAFGLLTVGCCPGGSGSNVWTVLLRGDLNLSMTMTFVSTIMALAMMPFWMFFLGRYFLDYKLISIPYAYIMINLVQVIVPAILGVLFRWKWESKALKLIKMTKLLALGFILFILIFGTYANFYMYIMIFEYPNLIPVAAMLPWLGFLFGFVSGMICRQGIVRSLTISIEVGIQNIGIAILILKFSMPKPLGDIAAIVPIIVAMVTPFPLMLGYVGDLIIRNCKEKCAKNEEADYPLSDFAKPPNHRKVKSKETQKQSVIEPTLYYSEEQSSFFDEPSPSLG